MSKADKLLAIARAEVGYLEKVSNAGLDSKTGNAGYGNYTKYGRWFGWNGVAWCHIFVSWAAAQAGCADIIPKTASCYEGRDYFVARKRFIKRGEGAPKPGDIVYFSSQTYPSGGAHVGIVTGVQGGFIETVEGNTSSTAGVIENGGAVAAKRYALSYNRIYGFGRPNYEEDDNMSYEQFRAYMERYEKEREGKSPSAWASKAWRALTEAGITDGTAPRAPLTREQYAVMQARQGMIGK